MLPYLPKWCTLIYRNGAFLFTEVVHSYLPILVHCYLPITNIVNNIVRVSYNSVNGGKIGGYVSFIVTKDSIVYSLGDNKTAKNIMQLFPQKGFGTV